MSSHHLDSDRQRALTRFIKHLTENRYKRSTIKQYCSVVQRFLHHHREHHPAHLTHAEITAYLKHPIVAGLHVNTIRVMEYALMLYVESRAMALVWLASLVHCFTMPFAKTMA